MRGFLILLFARFSTTDPFYAAIRQVDEIDGAQDGYELEGVWPDAWGWTPQNPNPDYFEVMVDHVQCSQEVRLVGKINVCGSANLVAVQRRRSLLWRCLSKPGTGQQLRLMRCSSIFYFRLLVDWIEALTKGKCRIGEKCCNGKCTTVNMDGTCPCPGTVC